MTALTDLGSAQYQSFAGGLYPDGENSRPSVYEDAGVTLGMTVQALDEDGISSPSGKIGMISIGMSNASREFLQFIRLANADARKNPRLLMIDAAQNGADATKIAVPSGNYWKHVGRQLRSGGITVAQVQVVWLKTALAHEARSFPENARVLQESLWVIVEILRAKFPQLKLVYLSSRTYGGYSDTDLSPEPIAYESGFAVKWLIEECIKSQSPDRSRPWLSWGPYLWANGATPRSDGLIWERSDVEADGVHPSAKGALKVAAMLLEFFGNDPTTLPWFFSRSSVALK